MSSASNAQPVMEQQADRVAPLSPTSPFAWSVRREVWEHRAIFIAPGIASGLILFGFVLRMFKLPQLLHAMDKMPPLQQSFLIGAPFAISAGAIAFTGLVVAVFYCLGALNNERRDRSILFWKSLPVSDLTTVLSKAFIPFVVLPVVVFVIALATQLVMLLLGSAVFAANGMGFGTLSTHWPMLRMTVVFLYFVAVNVLWHAPIYGWLLMVSSWARRMAFLWAVLPWLGMMILEKIALDTSYVGSFVGYRINGAIAEGFNVPHIDKHHMPTTLDPIAILQPAHFFSTPGLWLGLLAAALMIAAAVYFRRMREPG